MTLRSLYLTGERDNPDLTAVPDRRRLSLAVTASAAVAAGLLVGALSGSGLPLLVLLAAPLVPVVLIGTLLRPELGLLVLVFTVYSHISDIAVSRGTPSLLQPYLLLLLLALAAHTVRKGSLPDGLGTPLVLLGTYGAIQSLSLFFVVDAEPSINAVNVYARDAVVALLVVALLRSARSLEQFVWVLVLTGGALALLGVLQYATGSFANDFGGFAQAEVKNIAGNDEDWRISGPIADPNHYAQALLVIAALALGRVRRSRTALARALAALSLTATVLAVIFTFSRGALVALALVALIAAWERPPPVWSFGVAAAVLVIGLQSLPSGYEERLEQLAAALPGVSSGRPEEASLSGRLSAVEAGKGMVLDNPVLGVGVGQFRESYRDYALGLGIDTVKRGVEPHNMLLEVAAETGYLGTLAWGAVLGVALWRLRTGRRALRAAGRLHEADLVEDLRLGLYGYLLSGLFVHNAYPRLYWLLIGAALATPAVVRAVRQQDHEPDDRSPAAGALA